MPLFTGRELLKQDVRVEYFIPPFLTLGGTLLLAAPNKSMKTFLGLHMGAAIAAGQPFIDMPTQQARVLYIDYEIGIAEAKARYTPISNHYGISDEFVIRTSDETPISLDSGTNGEGNLFALLKEVRPGVVFFDTLRMSHSGEESSSTDMARVFTVVRRLKTAFGFTAVIIHHMGKEPDERSSAPRTSRGSSVIEDFPDSIGYITKHVTGHTEFPRLSIRWKLRNHKPIEDDRFSFDPGRGLFIRTPKKEKAVKHETSKHRSDFSHLPEPFSEASDLSAGLLPAM
jgi:hypothetical protein